MDAAAEIRRLGSDSQELVHASKLRKAGVCSRDLAADSSVIRVMRAVYSTAALPPWPRYVVTDKGPSPAYLAHVRAALLSLGPSASAMGRTAAALRGWALLVEPGTTIEVAVPHTNSRLSRPNVKISQRRQLEVVSLGYGDYAGLNVTSAVQTAIDCCLGLPLRQAVVVCDSALRSKQVTLQQLRAAAARLAGVRHAARVRRVLDLCDPLSESVLESLLRLLLVQAGVTGFETQRVLRDAQNLHVLRSDFCFEVAQLVVEVDGQKWHQDPVRDRERDNALARIGFRVLRYTWSDVVRDGSRVVAEIRQALAAAPHSIHLDGGALATPPVAA